MLKTPLLTQTDYIPNGLLDANPESLYKLLPSPTLLHLSGTHSNPLFVSVLLHGNEPTSFYAVQALLKKFAHRTLPRSLSIFFGNIQAAGLGLRRLEQQPDFNRIWPGTELPDSTETRMAAEVTDIMKARNVFASVDIHNNTGLNPHYACINKLDHRFLQLASIFGRLIVYFTRPKGVQSGAFAEICPAVTLECGRPGQKNGVAHAFEYLNSCLNLAELPDHPIHPQDVDIFHTVAQVKIHDHINFSFNDTNVDLFLDKSLDHMNFNEVQAGTVFGKTKNSDLPLIATNEHGKNVSDQFFAIRHNELQISRNTMPSMLTLDERVIKQDCLCYLMERIKL